MNTSQNCFTWNISLQNESGEILKELASITCKNPFKSVPYKEHRELFRRGIHKGILCVERE